MPLFIAMGSQMETAQPQTSNVGHSNAFVKLDGSASARYFAAYLHMGSRGQTGHDGIDQLPLGGNVSLFSLHKYHVWGFYDIL